MHSISVDTWIKKDYYLTLTLYSSAVKAACEYEYDYDDLFMTKTTGKYWQNNCVINNWRAWKKGLLSGQRAIPV